MTEELPYSPLPVTDAAGRSVAQADLTAPDLHYARPMGTWVIVGALFVVVVGLWTLVAAYFSLHA
ncbi:hypothetical protein [Thiomonas bhubaneswarensis]|uniref:Uncharacterized protein n=1 Tax=Thiomonas bhubaneswarensis TaxID=339866 RepID=A0A0K6I760_9BURK|nr:hypothetical protein [Thiomonas bhubaneswarensis]CUA98974.1 hypothetical protein Ga0061069_108111 [Thiomonas bhubaneswarensis]